MSETQSSFFKLAPILVFILILKEVTSWNFGQNGNDWNIGLCKTGAMQSPIRLNSSLVTYAMDAKLSINYQDLENVYLYRSADTNFLFMNFSD